MHHYGIYDINVGSRSWSGLRIRSPEKRLPDSGTIEEGAGKTVALLLVPQPSFRADVDSR
jgi:hypothetical protein